MAEGKSRVSVAGEAALVSDFDCPEVCVGGLYGFWKVIVEVEGGVTHPW